MKDLNKLIDLKNSDNIPITKKLSTSYGERLKGLPSSAPIKTHKSTPTPKPFKDKKTKHSEYKTTKSKSNIKNHRSNG